jgi:plastocyanin
MALMSRILGIVAAAVSLAVAAVALAAFGPGVPQAHAATHSITMAHYAFAPAQLTVRVGDSITWTNTDTAPHDVTTTSAPVTIHSSTVATGKTWTYMFMVPGTYQYICSIHPDMHATVTVIAAPATQSAAAPARTVAPAAPAGPAKSSGAAGASVTAAVPARTTAPRSSVPAVTPATRGQSMPSVTAASAQVASITSDGRLKPLLLVAGIIAAVATLCLLILASTPRGDT